MKVEIKNLKRYFGETRAVDDISFSFSSGEVYGFIGPNGAGKTTTMRILATLDEPTEGGAFIDGVSVTDEPEKARQLIGFMPDNLPTHRDISIHDYLDFFARAYNIKGARRRSVVESVEEFTSLVDIREKMLNALSKGMKQRVNLARALIHDPPLLILDEPAAGLDPRARIELRELLKIVRQQGKAILISSHILSELGEICDGAAIIEYGKLLRAGSLQEIAAANTESGEAISTVSIRPITDPAGLHRFLLEDPRVKDARQVGDEVEADVLGDDHTTCDLLEGLVKVSPFRIAEFRQRRAALEEVFMNVTKGEVQ
ncbi:MAG: ABC transporter ATP-binding protein [Planctomycetota bacterium]